MKQKIQIIFLFFFFQIGLFAQVDSLILPANGSLKVDSIIIEGNNTTKDYIIFRELTIKPGDVVTGKVVDFNSERVFSLGIFNKVLLYFRQEINPERNILVIHVEESWYIYPIPFVKLRDKDLSQSSYGLYITYKNFRGRNEEIKSKLSFGYDPQYFVEYYNPIVWEALDISMTTSLTYQKIQNVSEVAEGIVGEEFSYRYRMLDFSFGKRINPFNTLYTYLGFTYLDVPFENSTNILASNTSVDRVFSAGLGYLYDTRDLKQYAESGIYGSAIYRHYGFGNKNISYNVFLADYRQYQKIISKLTLKWRGVYRHTFGGNVPYYDKSYLGHADYVRGHKNDHREGNNYILSSLELVQPIIKNWNISLDLPLLPKKLTSARVELYLSGFMDTGIVYDNNAPLSINNFDSGWGFGLTVLVLPFNAIRFEFGFDEFRKGEFILGTGFSF